MATDEFYRAMKAERGRPVTGQGSAMLGVRVHGEYADVRPDTRGFVGPGSGGLSVYLNSPHAISPAWRPIAHGGRNRTTELFSLAGALLPQTLQARQDGAPAHHLLEPSVIVRLSQFQATLQDTAPSWRRR